MRRDLCERALGIFERDLGPEHPETAATLTRLASAYGGLGDFEQKRDLLERALAIMEGHGPSLARGAVSIFIFLSWMYARAMKNPLRSC